MPYLNLGIVEFEGVKTAILVHPDVLLKHSITDCKKAFMEFMKGKVKKPIDEDYMRMIVLKDLYKKSAPEVNPFSGVGFGNDYMDLENYKLKLQFADMRIIDEKKPGIGDILLMGDIFYNGHGPLQRAGKIVDIDDEKAYTNEEEYVYNGKILKNSISLCEMIVLHKDGGYTIGSNVEVSPDKGFGLTLVAENEGEYHVLEPIEENGNISNHRISKDNYVLLREGKYSIGKNIKIG